jgi:hypothetical protein
MDGIKYCPQSLPGNIIFTAASLPSRVECLQLIPFLTSASNSTVQGVDGHMDVGKAIESTIEFMNRHDSDECEEVSFRIKFEKKA